jgi:hypothetical protein
MGMKRYWLKSWQVKKMHKNGGGQQKVTENGESYKKLPKMGGLQKVTENVDNQLGQNCQILLYLVKS